MSQSTRSQYSATAAAAQPHAVHCVQFFRDERQLADSVGRFVREALALGDGVVVLATPEHTAALRETLADSSAAAAGIESGALVLADAAETLARIRSGTGIDEAAFARVCFELVERARAAAPGNGVRVYGEMVDVLWRDAEPGTMLQLEALWSRAIDRLGIELLCGYTAADFAQVEHSGIFSQVCAAHTDVALSPEYAALSEPDKLRALAALEQRAQALEAEVERRKSAEQLRDRLYEAERAARAHTARLQRATASLGSVLTREDIATVGLRALAEALGAETSSLSLLVQGGTAIETIAAVGVAEREWRELACLPIDARVPAAEAIRSGRAVYVESSAERDRRYPDMADGPLRRGTRASLPLIIGGRPAGAINFAFAGWRELATTEREFAAAIAALSAQALERIQLYESERDARARAERFAARAARLQSITAALATASTVADVAQIVVGEAVSATSAATGGLWLVHATERVAELVHGVGHSGAVAHFRRIPLDAAQPIPVARAIDALDAVWLSSRREFAERYPEVEALVATAPEMAVACMPLLLEGRRIGALAFTWREPRDFTPEERQFLLVLAQHSAQALERARLFELEQSARKQAESAEQRTAFLLEASVLLSNSLDFQDALNRLAWLAVPRMADWCSVEIATEPHMPVQQLAVAHVDPDKVELARELRRRYPPSAAEPIGTSAVIRAGRPELYPQVEDAMLAASAHDETHLAMLRALGLRSLMIVPMTARGRTFGALAFASTESGRRYGPADLELGELLGRRAGIAIDNALLFAQANAAVRAREEVLAVVSHDLRNPLNAIIMNATNLLRLEIADRAGARVRKSGEAIQRSAERMSRLIGDLMDFASIQAGRFGIERAACTPADIVNAAVEMFTALADERELTIETRVETDLPELFADPDRVIQALGNLLSNALKVTAVGSTVRVSARRDRAELTFAVEDSGPGIRADEIPRLFERYYRSEKAGYRGTGLGLAIAKGIVTAHGGRIWAESVVGQGSRFSFAIPLAPRA